MGPATAAAAIFGKTGCLSGRAFVLSLVESYGNGQTGAQYYLRCARGLSLTTIQEDELERSSARRTVGTQQPCDDAAG